MIFNRLPLPGYVLLLLLSLLLLFGTGSGLAGGLVAGLALGALLPLAYDGPQPVQIAAAGLLALLAGQPWSAPQWLTLAGFDMLGTPWLLAGGAYLLVAGATAGLLRLCRAAAAD